MLEGKRALILEDEPVIAFALEDMLRSLGCIVVETAMRVERALGAAASTAPDLAVLDVNVNDEQSFAVADALSAAGVPFVFATGYGSSTVPDRHRNVPLVTKPYGVRELGQALNDAVSRGPAGLEPRLGR
jgi:CheY-like chemotaxis protein